MIEGVCRWRIYCALGLRNIRTDVPESRKLSLCEFGEAWTSIQAVSYRAGGDAVLSQMFRTQLLMPYMNQD